MADKHESIKRQVLTDWTVSARGRLYQMESALAVPVHGKMPRYFGPVPGRRFKGFPDLFGFEILGGVPVFCLVEIKTIKDVLSDSQKTFIKAMLNYCVRCYLAKEQKDGGYILIKLNEFSKELKS